MRVTFVCERCGQRKRAGDVDIGPKGEQWCYRCVELAPQDVSQLLSWVSRAVIVHVIPHAERLALLELVDELRARNGLERIGAAEEPESHGQRRGAP